MEDLFEEYMKNRPQRLCKGCGQCCKTVTTGLTNDTLLQMAKNDDKGAIDFLEIFEPYSSIEEAKQASPETVNNIFSYIDESERAKATFYKCKHLAENNLCQIYEKRPELCHIFPSSPWAVVPPGCGFEGWLFQVREEIKQKVRKEKEILLTLEILLKTAPEQEAEEISSSIKRIKDIINVYAKYGSADW